MEEKKYLDLLAKRDIQPTAIRILVLRTMMQAGRSVSLLDLETMLGYGGQIHHLPYPYPIPLPSSDTQYR